MDDLGRAQQIALQSADADWRLLLPSFGFDWGWRRDVNEALAQIATERQTAHPPATSPLS
jgi:hypothetical protein